MADATQPGQPQRRQSHVTVTMDHMTGEIGLTFESRHLDEAMNMLHTALRHVETQWRTAKIAAMQAEAHAQAQIAGMLTRQKH